MDDSGKKALAASLAAALLLAQAAPAGAGCVVTASEAFLKASGYRAARTINTPAHISTEAECYAWIRSQWPTATAWELKQFTCGSCSGGGGGGGGGFRMPTAQYGSRAFGQQLALGIVEQGLQNLFAPPKGPSPEEIARKQAEEEAARRAAAEEARRIAEERARQERLERERRLALATQMQGVDGGGGAVDFDGALAGRGGALAGWKGLDDGAAAAPAPSGGGALSSLQRLRCAQFLSDMARQSASLPGGDEGSRFYGEQARKVLDGLPAEVECPALPAVPEPSAPQRVDNLPGTVPELMELARARMASLDTVERGLAEAGERKRKAEEKKRAAEGKRAEAEKAAASPPPPPGEGEAAAQDPDALLREAEALLAESESELAESVRAEKELAKEKGELAEGLRAVEARLGELETKGTAAKGR